MKTTVVNCRTDEYDTYAGRGRCPRTGQPGKYGNPFKIGEDGTREEVIEKYRRWLLLQHDLIEDMKKNLKGKRLGCWCVERPIDFIRKDKRCHGEVILEILGE